MIALLLLLAGCGPAPETPPAFEPAAVAGAFTAGESPAAGEVAFEPCEGRSTQDVGRTVAVRLWVGAGVEPDRVRALVDEAVAWWAGQGVELVVAEPVGIDLEAPLGGSRDGLDQALRARGIEPGAPVGPEMQPGLIAAASQVVLGPVHAHLLERAVPPADGVDVVIVQRIATPDSPVDRAFVRLEGLTFRADLADRADAIGTLTRQLGIEAFTPTVFVGLAGLDAAEPDRWSGTLAHELGHALGLEHTTDPRDLMVEVSPRCVPGLGAEAAAVLREARSYCCRAPR